MCGVCTLKPTYGRHVSKIGMRMPHEHLELVLPRHGCQVAIARFLDCPSSAHK